MIPRYSEQDYRKALLNLLPLGPLWAGFRSGAAGSLFLMLGRVYERNNSKAADLIADLFPGTTEQFLLEWEKTLGLPDSCVVSTQTQSERRAAVVDALTDEGGSSVAYYQRIASRHGVQISVRQFAPARAGVLRAGDPCYGSDWAYAWEVGLPQTVVSNFLAGRSCAGEPIRQWGAGYLECVLLKRSPAHTVLIFAYDGVDVGISD